MVRRCTLEVGQNRKIGKMQLTFPADMMRVVSESVVELVWKVRRSS